MKFKCLLLIFVFTIILTDAAPTLKRDADAEVKQFHDWQLGWGRREANSFEGDEDEPINEEPVYWNEEPAADWQDPFT
ncbi:unnamed protein product [Rhizophagus irregularis]|nr:unnamed protein product [Rhizophagus irregularis]CAB4418879.1 unnamed protein product [Rhizophagus irregularis]